MLQQNIQDRGLLIYPKPMITDPYKNIRPPF